MDRSSIKLYQPNIEGQDMEKYKLFVVPIGNEKVKQKIEFYPRAPVLKYYQQSYNNCCLSGLASTFHSIGENKAATALANHIGRGPAQDAPFFYTLSHLR